MDENTKNFGEITFKVKLVDSDTHHDISLKFSNESQNYEGKQLFDQIALITGIPSKYTQELLMRSNSGRFRQIFSTQAKLNQISLLNFDNEHLTCNKLVKDVINDKDQFDCDCFILKFKMWNAHDNHFYVSYELISQLLVPKKECSSVLCQHSNSGIVLDKMMKIITNDELHSKMKTLLDKPGFFINKCVMHFNILQYAIMPCSFFGTIDYHGHTYIRARG